MVGKNKMTSTKQLTSTDETKQFVTAPETEALTSAPSNGFSMYVVEATPKTRILI